MDERGWAILKELQTAYAHATLSDIVSLLLFLIPLLFIASLPLIWALRKQYHTAMKRFEEENPDLKGQYFSFWKWFDISGEHGHISTKHFKKRFGDVPFVNTDCISYEVQQFKERSKGFGKNFSLPTKIAIVLLVAIMASALV